MKDVTQSSQDWEDFWYNSPTNSPYIVMTNQTKQVTYIKHELETILYSLEGYIQGNDDLELVDELVDICYKIEAQLEEVK